jgi:hypothetical protein
LRLGEKESPFKGNRDLKLRISFVAFVILYGCDIFQTRTPQPPQQGQSNFIPATSPDIVMQNLRNAIAEKNVNNYLSCLSDTSFGGRKFTFVPPPDVYRQYAQIFLAWDKNSEQAYFDNLTVQSSATSSPALTLSSVSLTGPIGDSATYSATYSLLWPNKVSGYPQSVEGNLQFYLGVDKNQNWAIYKWIDLRVADSLTWSEMKARFSQ